MQRSVSALVLAAAVLSAACAAPSAASMTSARTVDPSPAESVRPYATARPTSPTPSPVTDPVDLDPIPSLQPASPAPDILPHDGPYADPTSAWVRIYLWLDADNEATGLVPVLREVPDSERPEVLAVEAVLAGPSPSERGGSPRISTWIPEGTRLLGLEVSDTTAIVNLSREFAAPGDRISALGRLGQVAYTLTLFPWIRDVEFTVEDRPLTSLADGEVVLPGPVGRADPRDLGPNEPFLEPVLPTIFVDGPSWGETIYDQAIVQGTARLAGDLFTIGLYDASGYRRSLVDGAEPCPGPCGGGFEATIAFSVPAPQWGTLRVAERGPNGVTIPLGRDYPVWLVSIDEPAPGSCGC
jgi:spore germination protein GerM